MYSIVVHGGAGKWRPENHQSAVDGVRAAAQAGQQVLAAGGSALEAVIAAVVVLEDTPVFNAGTGACFNLDGSIELDAAIMVGEGLQTGAVAALKEVKNPILVARKVMEETDHVLLAGDGAQRFARAAGFPEYDPMTPERRATYDKQFARLQAGEDQWLPRMKALLEKYPELTHGTVGAAAVDQHGKLAAGTSTGGITLKMAGRVGDTPIPGAGNYATGRGAASATGQGELMMRTLTTREVCDRIAAGASAEEATREVIRHMSETVGTNAGVIAVDHAGGVGVCHATEAMPHAFATEAQPGVVAALKRD